MKPRFWHIAWTTDARDGCNNRNIQADSAGKALQAVFGFGIPDDVNYLSVDEEFPLGLPAGLKEPWDAPSKNKT